MQAVVTEKNVFSGTYVEEGAQPSGKTEPTIDKKGALVFVTNFIRSWNLETWVRRVARTSGQPVDWAYNGRVADIKTLGDIRTVRLAIAGLLHEHDALWRVMSGPKSHDADIRTYPSRSWLVVRDQLRSGSVEDARIVYGLAPYEAFTIDALLTHYTAKVSVVGPHRFHSGVHLDFAVRHVQLLDEAKNILLRTIT